MYSGHREGASVPFTFRFCVLFAWGFALGYCSVCVGFALLKGLLRLPQRGVAVPYTVRLPFVIVIPALRARYILCQVQSMAITLTNNVLLLL